ncbi:MAG: hypothetical protein FWG83_07600 [Oscillospiraceae bacterium]|nr:hypothetical protein [Oscillospiraceae bacterium]
MKKLLTAILALSLSVSLTACNKTAPPVEESDEYKALLEKVSELEEQLAQGGNGGNSSSSVIDTAQPRIFYNGNSDIWLNTDGTFVLNYFHNTKISGTYTEIADPDSDEIAVMFTHNGISYFGVEEDHHDDDDHNDDDDHDDDDHDDDDHDDDDEHNHDDDEEETAYFVSSGDKAVTVVGSIVGDTLTLPEDWTDDHGHGDKYKLRETLVFAGGNGKITLNPDRSFIADFGGGISIKGYHIARAFAMDHNPENGEPMPYGYNMIIFIPGEPTISADGEVRGAVISAPIEDGKTLQIPEAWEEIAGASSFALQ